MSAVIYLIHSIISLYIWVIIIAAILSFVQPNPTNPNVRNLIIAIYRLTEPLFNWVRVKFPFVVINGVDLSPIVIILALQFLDNLFLGMLIR